MIEEMMGTLEDVIQMNCETFARLSLLCELLIEQGYLNEEEVIQKLSQKEVYRFLDEAVGFEHETN